MVSDTPLPLLQLAFRPDLNIPVGRWGYQPQPRELPAVYQQVQELAVEHGCRFWLQDIRRRTLNDPQTTLWLLNNFFPDVARRLGGRLFVAYLVGPTLHQTIISQPGFVSAEAYADKPFVLSFFGDEGAAIQWLQAQQDDAAR